MYNSGTFWCCVLLWCSAIVTSSTADATDGKNDKNSTRGVDEFLASLTQMIGSVLNSDARFSQITDDGQKSVSGRPNRPAADYFETGRPPFIGPQGGDRPYLENGNRPYPENGYRPYPENGDRPFLENGNRPYPPPPPHYPGNPYGPRPGYPGQYPPQNSILQALSSISQHDDLRCVPRLLCEVSSGTRPQNGYYQPGYYQQQQQQSSLPFLSKEALITLLTVLNFVDDSPLLMFGRAALLGYNARGDPRSCITAYPTCPRDPDQLINYLNNHNGGFFRFFNQQLPEYAPQYASHQQPPFQRPPYPLNPGPHNPGPLNPGPPYPGPPYQRPPYQRPLYQRPPSYQQQYAPQYPRPQQEFGVGDYKTRSDRGFDDQQRPRILIGSPSQYYDVPSVQDLALDIPRPSMTFPSDDHSVGSANSVSSFVFPSDQHTKGNNRQSKRIKMVFPDRTGTGGLRADVDKYGNYKGVYYADGTIKFVDDADNKRPTKIRLPDLISSSSSFTRPSNHFDVFGERLPFERPNKFQFPRTE